MGILFLLCILAAGNLACGAPGNYYVYVQTLAAFSVPFLLFLKGKSWPAPLVP